MLARLSLLILIAAGCAAPRPAIVANPVSLPAVDLVDLTGAPARLDGLVRGHVALVSLWATWCEACVREFDALERLRAGAEARGAMVVAIAEGERRESVADFVKWRGLRTSQLVDEEFRFGDALGQRRVPATLVVGPDGRILFAGGALDESALAVLRRVLDAHLAAK